MLPKLNVTYRTGTRNLSWIVTAGSFPGIVMSYCLHNVGNKCVMGQRYELRSSSGTTWRKQNCYLGSSFCWFKPKLGEGALSSKFNNFLHSWREVRVKVIWGGREFLTKIHENNSLIIQSNLRTCIIDGRKNVWLSYNQGDIGILELWNKLFHGESRISNANQSMKRWRQSLRKGRLTEQMLLPSARPKSTWHNLKSFSIRCRTSSEALAHQHD